MAAQDADRDPQVVPRLLGALGGIGRGRLVHLQDMEELREGRHVTAKLLGPPPATGPGGSPLPPNAIEDGRLDFDYRGPLPDLLGWLARLPLDELKVGPLGLTAIYRKCHGGDEAMARGFQRG